jgi:P27 family predicted phage terminase small subunit
MDELPEAPKSFNAATTKIWNGVCIELKRNGLLASCDLELLRGYCILLNQFEDAYSMTKKEGLVTVSRHGEQVVNPWYRVQCDSLKQATQLGQLFGITPSARSRISAAVVKPVSKLDSLKKPKTA